MSFPFVEHGRRTEREKWNYWFERKSKFHQIELCRLGLHHAQVKSADDVPRTAALIAVIQRVPEVPLPVCANCEKAPGVLYCMGKKFRLLSTILKFWSSDIFFAISVWIFRDDFFQWGNAVNLLIYSDTVQFVHVFTSVGALFQIGFFTVRCNFTLATKISA